MLNISKPKGRVLLPSKALVFVAQKHSRDIRTVWRSKKCHSEALMGQVVALGRQVVALVRRIMALVHQMVALG
jgi:hypothetical protein